LSRTPTGARTSALSARVQQPGAKESIMKKQVEKQLADELRPEYDLAKLEGGVRGKYAERFKAGTNLVLLSPDVAEYFPDAQSVNAALRSLVSIAKAKVHRAA